MKQSKISFIELQEKKQKYILCVPINFASSGLKIKKYTLLYVHE